MKTPTIEQCIKEVYREQGQRDWVYPKQVDNGKLTQKTLDRRKTILEQIVKNLRELEQLRVRYSEEQEEQQPSLFDIQTPEQILEEALKGTAFEKVLEEDQLKCWTDECVDIMIKEGIHNDFLLIRNIELNNDLICYIPMPKTAKATIQILEIAIGELVSQTLEVAIAELKKNEDNV